MCEGGLAKSGPKGEGPKWGEAVQGERRHRRKHGTLEDTIVWPRCWGGRRKGQTVILY